MPLKESKVGTGTLVYSRRLPVLLLPMLLLLLDGFLDRDDREGVDFDREGDALVLDGEATGAPL